MQRGTEAGGGHVVTWGQWRMHIVAMAPRGRGGIGIPCHVPELLDLNLQQVPETQSQVAELQL